MCWVAVGALQGQLPGPPRFARCQGLADRTHQLIWRAGGDVDGDWGPGGARVSRAPGLLVAEHTHGVCDQRVRGRIGAARQGLLHKGRQLCGEFLQLPTSSSWWIALSSIAYPRL